jgi:hypothetical protein
VVEIEDLFEGEDAVLAFRRERGHGDASGVEVNGETATLPAGAAKGRAFSVRVGSGSPDGTSGGASLASDL